MPTIVPIVEGHGEIGAVPILIRRVALEAHPAVPLHVARPIRIGKGELVRAQGIERAVELAARQSADGDGILVLLDADDDCPKEVSEDLLRRARAARPDRNVRVVLAKKEFEAWFLAGARSLRGKRGLSDRLEPPPDPEAIRDAKGWLSKHSTPGRSYRPTIDQPALSQLVALGEAMSARSFQKFVKDVEALVSARS